MLQYRALPAPYRSPFNRNYIPNTAHQTVGQILESNILDTPVIILK